MKKPIALISNDWHISHNNTDIIIDLIKQKLELSKKLGVTVNFVLGDVFQSREKQPLSVLKCFEYVLSLYHAYNIKLIGFPGNHDKTNYDSKDSFLDSFSWHPSFDLFKEFTNIKTNRGNIHIIPFFSEQLWLEEFSKSQAELTSGCILMSHIALTGSTNNDGKKVQAMVSPKDFNGYDLTLLGHYHNYQSLGNNVYHLPALRQNNYGENENKGFTIIYDDKTFEIHKADFPIYKTITIKVDENFTKKQFNKVVEANIPDGNTFVRLKVTGNEDNLKVIQVDALKMMGYDIKIDRTDVVASMTEALETGLVTFDNTTIQTEFVDFCEQEGYTNLETGINYLKRALQ